MQSKQANLLYLLEEYIYIYIEKLEEYCCYCYYFANASVCLSLFFCTFGLHKMQQRQSVCMLNSQLYDTYASVLLVYGSRASDFGLMKIDNKGKVISFSEKPKGADLKAMASFFVHLRFWCFLNGFY